METEKTFEDVQGMSMVDTIILATTVYLIIEDDWLKETSVDHEYCCDICLQWCYELNLLKLKTSKCDQEKLDRCYKENHEYIIKNLIYNLERFQTCNDGKQEWICKTCDKYLKKKRCLPAQKPIV